MSVRIKKYGNRKLYDENASSYLSMLDVADLAANDGDVVVKCDRTGRDLTIETLARALYERLKDYYDEDNFMSNGNPENPFSPKELIKLIVKVPGKRTKITSVVKTPTKRSGK